MKKSKTIKLILIILICILISLVSFLGIYVKKGNSYENWLPKYTLASDLKGSSVIEFEVDSSTDTLYYDKDGKKVDSSTVTDDNKSEYKKEEKLKNDTANLTEENYNTSMNIMKKRLKFLKADQYNLDLDKKTGKILLTFEDDYPEDIKSILSMEGKIELIDSNTQEVIIDYSDIYSAEATYASLDSGYTAYINLKLKSSGIDKINNIDKYKNATTENKDESNTEENAEENAKETVNKLKVMFDSDEIAEITYDDLLLNKKVLRVTTNKDLTKDSEVQSKLNTNTVIAKLVAIGKMPVVYKTSSEEFIKNNIYNYINYIVIGICIICGVISLYFILKYKFKGVIALITFATNISMFLVIIRLVKIPISLNAFAGILSLIVLNTILINNILISIKEKNKTFSDNIKTAYLKTIDIFIILLIIFSVFSFSSMTVINSMGLLLFWGWLIVLIGNLVLTVPSLSIINKEE